MIKTFDISGIFYKLNRKNKQYIYLKIVETSL